MIPKEAIEKAIEGGWNHSRHVQYHRPNELVLSPVRGNTGEYKTLKYEQIALDPSFWQALGKALGWHGFFTDFMDPADEGKILPSNEWHQYAHEFYHLILTGGDTEAFWKDLLTSKE